MIPTTAIILDTRRAKSNEKYPVKLRVTFMRKQKYYSTGIDLTENEYEKIHSTKPRGKYKETKIKLVLLEKNAISIIENISDFSYNLFEKKFLNPRHNYMNVFDAYEEYIINLRKEGRIGTASSYSCSLGSLKKFTRELKFEDIDSEFLRKYEKWMIENGNSLTTVVIYLHALRTLVNEAKQLKIITEEQYPFGKRKYQIPSGRNVKKALSLEDVEKIYNHKPPRGSFEEKAKDIWLFSYLMSGLNIKDIARLKYKNIEGDKLILIRSKTERTSRHNQKPIVAILIEETKKIIEKWGINPIHPDSYIFPILQKNITPQREYELIKQFTKNVNKWMRRIASNIGIEKDVTTYTARHSFSTISKWKGISTEYISEALGHSDLKTTENYLDSFEDHVKKEYAESLLAFKTNK